MSVELPLLRERLGVVSIGVFGSVSWGEGYAGERCGCSDDISARSVYFANIISLEDYLGTVFDRRVDVVMDGGGSRYLKPYIEAEVIMVEG
ncbi:MAG: nucleotidyltransferase [Methanocorpusculum sp.]|nr:nucleotidyltransferase [Methanocorpusculum sp.]